MLLYTVCYAKITERNLCKLFKEETDMYWYIELNGTILPTPYRTMRDAFKACEEFKERLGPCITRVLQQ